MPRGPKGEKRPADVIGNAVNVLRIATGEISETTTAKSGKVSSGKAGAKARASELTPKQRRLQKKPPPPVGGSAMPANKYKIWGGAVGSPLHDGVSASVNVGVATIAKKSNVKEPNIVINELACNLIARSLFLPCPPGILLDHGGDTYFCSMNFNLAGEALPPIPVQSVLSMHPRLCWGIILFDVLMMNPDRHRRNLAFDRTSGGLQIFDHSRAFLPLTADIDSVVRDNDGKLGLGTHCLQPEIDTLDGFDIWSGRIKALPDFAIEETVSAVCKIGFPSDKSKMAADFLKSRRDGIDALVTTNIGQFAKLQSMSFAPAPAPSSTAASVPPPPINNP